MKPTSRPRRGANFRRRTAPLTAPAAARARAMQALAPKAFIDFYRFPVRPSLV
jgi:hypothetical protein